MAIKTMQNTKALKQILSVCFFSTVLMACGKSPKVETVEPIHQETEVAKEKTEPTPPTEPAAPSMSYEVLPVTDTGVGYDDIFTLPESGEGKGIYYQGRAGLDNILEQIFEDTEYIEGIGYLKVEHAYKFGDAYVLIFSTGESGNSCPATTRVFSYDIKSESVTGKTDIDGCSETVQALAEGNKLIVKKDGETTTIYNGKVE